MADHARCWAKHQTLTDPKHAAAAALLRRQAPPQQPAVEQVQTRSLGDYDAAFGLEGVA